MKIDFCFQGWLRGVKLDEDTFVTDSSGKSLYVDHLPPQDIVGMLNKGEAFISLVDVLDQSDCSHTELFDFKVVE